MKKYLLSTTVILISLISALFLTFLLSDSKIKENVVKSIENYDFMDNKKYNLDIDNYTDMIILNVITYNSKNSFIKRALGNEYGFMYINKYGNKEIYWNQYENLKSSLNNQNDSSMFYGRYWHGSQIIIKPLLRFFTYQQSLIFLTIVGIMLIILSCILIQKKLGWKYLIIYILSLLSLNIYIFNSCYQYFFTIIPMIIFNIIILLKYKNTKFDSYLYFYIFGSLSAYFMYISFPLITLCYPLLIFMALEFKNNRISCYKEHILNIVKISINWLIGYILFYLLKWVIGTVFVGENFIEDALMSTSQRLGITFSFKYIDVLMLNLHYFFNNKLNIFLLLSSIILIILKIRKNFINKLKIISPILLILLMPFIWMFVCNNHSAVHYWMISRIFSISIFSLMMIALVLFNDSKYSELEKLNINDYFALICSLAFFIFYKFNIIIIILYVLVILIVKIDKKLKLFISLLLMISSLLLIGKSLNKNNFNNKEFFQNIYNELYDKAISYGLEYAKKNNIQNIDKVDIRDLIDTINADSVFLLSCKGYITIDNFSVKPYINCNDAIITEGYINN